MDPLGSVSEEYLDIFFRLIGLPTLFWESGDEEGGFAALGLLILSFMVPILLGFLIGALWMSRRKNKRFREDREYYQSADSDSSRASRHGRPEPRQQSRQDPPPEEPEPRRGLLPGRSRGSMGETSSTQGPPISGSPSGGATSASQRPADRDRTDADQTVRP